MNRFVSVGFMSHITEDGKERLVVTVDPEIARYYLSTLPAGTSVQKQKYPPHITVVDRNEKAENLSKFDKISTIFYYSAEIREDDTYYWLDAFSNDLVAIRWACGLSTPFPCMNKKFHITIGNKKLLK